MKKIVKLSAVLSLICLLLCACGGRKPEDTAAADPAEQVEDGSSTAADSGNGQDVQEEEQQPAAGPELTVEDLVGTQFAFEGQRGSEEMGYTTDVIYIVPEILSDKNAAKAINDDIRTFCLDVIEPTQDEMDFPTWYNVGYEAYLNGDILSILITKLCTMDDASSYATFNYNVKEESVVDNVALLKSCGYTEDIFVEQMRRAVAYETDEDMRILFDAEYWKRDDISDAERQAMYADQMRYRQNSISADRVGVQVPMYLDGQGALKAFAEIDVPAGAGSYSKALTPRAESRAKDFEISFEDSLFLTYRGGVMKIRIEDGDWTRNAFGGSGSNLEFGREYTVEGICKDYVDGAMQFVCDGEYAVPVFVSDDGMVSALNLYYCAPAGYFCMTEPVMGLKEIDAITEENGSEIAAGVGDTLFGQCPGMAQKTLGIYGQEGFEKNDHYIGFDDQDEGKFLYQVEEAGYDGALCYTGECVLIGMNEDGLIFSSRVYADFTEPFDPDAHYTAFSLKKYYQWNDLSEDSETWAEFRSLCGFITMDGTGDVMVLDVSYG